MYWDEILEMCWVKFKHKYINQFSIVFFFCQNLFSDCKTKLANFNNNQLKLPIEGHYSNHPEPILSSFHLFCRRFFAAPEVAPEWLQYRSICFKWCLFTDFFVINGISYIRKAARQSKFSFPSLKLSILIKMQMIKIGATV